MEGLQCDGCDFRAESYEDLNTHILEVHTVFLQPSDADESDSLRGEDEEEEEEDEYKEDKDDKDYIPPKASISRNSSKGPNKKAQKPTTETHLPFYQCQFCVCYFRSKSFLRNHTKKVHNVTEEKLDTRVSSDKVTKEHELLNCQSDEGVLVIATPPQETHSHPGLSISNNPYQCTVCLSEYNTLHGLHIHYGKKHPGMKVKAADFAQEADINPSSVYKCRHCPYVNSRIHRVLTHYQKRHPLGKVTAEDFADNIEPISELHDGDDKFKTQRQGYGAYRCKMCPYTHGTLEKLKIHYEKYHNQSASDLFTPSLRNFASFREIEPMAECSSSNMSRTAKVQEVRELDFALAQLPINKPKKHAVFKCQLCKYFCSTRKGIVRHYRIKHDNVRTQLEGKSTNSSSLSKRSASTDVSNSISHVDTDLVNEDDSRSSLDNDDKEVGDIDNPSYTGTLSTDAKQLLTDGDNKLLKTKGIQFRRHMNQFQCPFCSFLTIHRRSISRHIENIHLSGKTTVYKCDECPFICTSPLKLGTHKQNHNPSDLETLDLTGDSPEPQNDGVTEPLDGGNVSSRVNGKKPTSTSNDQQNPHRCTLCSFSSTTLKGLRVHQQHKHSYCDDLDSTVCEAQTSDQPDAEVEASPAFLQKTQTSILGSATKKTLVAGKRTRKSINDLTLDLSSVRKRTRIDEIASNLLRKISQSQQDMIINLDDMDDKYNEENNGSGDEGKNNDNKNTVFAYNTHLFNQESSGSQDIPRTGKRKCNSMLKRRGIPISLTLSDEGGNISAESSVGTIHENLDYSDDSGAMRFYCKHCEYHNKSARSVSTHYQRMHPYIKFSFKYILDPEDQSAVFHCLECYIEYINYNDLHQHYMDHHPEASNLLNFNQQHLLYMCRFCSYTSPNVRSLMPHYQRMHPTVKINNAMIFSSYIVEQSHKTNESQTLREILNSGPKSFNSSSSVSRSSSSLVPKTAPKSPEVSGETESLKETINNVVAYDCDVCSFSSANMHSVLVHYQKKHPEQKASYFRIQKTMKVVSVDPSHPLANSSLSPAISSTLKQSNVTPSVYGSDEEMYYCKHSVYSNKSVVGVLNHYQKRYPEVKVTAKYTKQGPPTPGLMKLMDELQIAAPKQFLKQFQNNGRDGSKNTKLDGGVEKGEEELFFCQHCDYGNRTVKGVLIHYQKKHRETKANADLVRRHTAVVRSQREQAQMVQSGSTSSTAISASADHENATPMRSLKCRQCPYTTPYVYALKKHLKKEHPTVKATAVTILHWAYQDGILEAGYHCEWCIYSHADPQGLLLHYQTRHPEHNVDYAYMASKLWAGPETTQQGNTDTKHYKCKDCAFEACSIWDITSHYQAVHPWAIKEDESVLLDIIKGDGTVEGFQQQVTKEHGLLNCQSDEGVLVIATPPQETHSHPRLSISNNPYQCTVCLSEYNTLHGLHIHCGKKHPGMKVKAADFAQEADINPSSVYKCQHCSYANSRIHRVLTHYQKRHPLVKVTAEDFADNREPISELHEGDDKFKTQRQGYGAYRCKMCPYTHGTLEKLKIHYEKYHNQPASDIFTPFLSNFASFRETEPMAECSSSNMSSTAKVQEVRELDFALSQLPINKPEKHAVFKCQLCKYFCSTRKSIARHYRIKHNNVRVQPEGKSTGSSSLSKRSASTDVSNSISHVDSNLVNEDDSRSSLDDDDKVRDIDNPSYTGTLPAKQLLTDGDNKLLETKGIPFRRYMNRFQCPFCSFLTMHRRSISRHIENIHLSGKTTVYKCDECPFICTSPLKLGTHKQNHNPSDLETLDLTGDSPEPQNDFATEPLDGGNVSSRVNGKKPTSTSNDQQNPHRCTLCSFSSTTLKGLRVHQQHKHSYCDDLDSTVCEAQTSDQPDAEVEASPVFLQETQTSILGSATKKTLVAGKRTRKSINDLTLDLSSVKKRTRIVEIASNLLRKMSQSQQEMIINLDDMDVQYGEAKRSRVKQEVTDVPLTVPSHTLTNGVLEEDEAAEVDGTDGPETSSFSPPFSTRSADQNVDDVGLETLDPDAEVEGRAAARATASGTQLNHQPATGGHACSQCDRVFMSMQGLRSHERSHSAMALFNKEDKYSCQYCHFVSPFRHNLDRHVQSHHGHHKPFKCKFCPFKSAYASRLKSHLHKAHTGEQYTYKCLSCPFSSMTISQLKEHSLTDHSEVLTLPKLRAATQAAHAAIRLPRQAAHTDHSHLTTDDLSDLEPADVCEELSRYRLASRSQMSSSFQPGGSTPCGLLTCEFCEFSSGYMQSLRRHYRDRHGGKKLFKCKDCSFFTCCKDNFSLHVKAGHNNSRSGDLPKELHCPLCLYHTKHKSNMIDHIVLHREDRVAPLEISRSKLSHHLEGLVLCCHKSTFTCSSDHALQLHLQKHDELKPYQCQLCYYDSSRSSQLEEHLRLEHKAIRNFDLMGRVNLDQLEMLNEQESSAEEEAESEILEMVAEGESTMQGQEEEEDEEEVDDDDDEGMEIIENMVDDQEETDDKGGEENIREDRENEAVEEEEQEEEELQEEEEEDDDEEEEEEEQEVKEVVKENTVPQEVLASPSSTSSGPSGGEKRLPCEFCGRCFTNSLEWERHVLRHGMVVNNMRLDTGSTSAAEASAPSSSDSSVNADSRPDPASNGKEEEDPTDLSLTSQSQYVEEDKDMLHTKTEQQSP